MAAVSEIKNARIEFKTTQEIKTLFQGAANALGMDLSSFLISTAMQRARTVMLEEKMQTLATEEWKRLQTRLEHPQLPTRELSDLMKLEGFDD